MSIVNNFTHPVILADDRDPDESWEHHLERGSAGGVDLAYPYGTEVALNADGRLVYDNSRSGSGGRIGTLYVDHPQIAYIQYLHLSDGRSGSFKAGDTPLTSGASGFGMDRYYDPHLHVHAYDLHGARVNLFHYFDTAPADTDTTPINPARKAAPGMASMFHTTTNDKPDGPIQVYALAGDGEGRAAWLEISTGSPDLANALAGQHLINGTSAWLSRSTWLTWKADYLGVPRGTVTVTGNPKGI